MALFKTASKIGGAVLVLLTILDPPFVDAPSREFPLFGEVEAVDEVASTPPNSCFLNTSWSCPKSCLFIESKAISSRSNCKHTTCPKIHAMIHEQICFRALQSVSVTIWNYLPRMYEWEHTKLLHNYRVECLNIKQQPKFQDKISHKDPIQTQLTKSALHRNRVWLIKTSTATLSRRPAQVSVVCRIALYRMIFDKNVMAGVIFERLFPMENKKGPFLPPQWHSGCTWTARSRARSCPLLCSQPAHGSIFSAAVPI